MRGEPDGKVKGDQMERSMNGRASDGVRMYNNSVEHSRFLTDNGESRTVGIVNLMMEHGVLDRQGVVYPPTKEVVLALLKHHAGDGNIVAIPVRRLALELRSKLYPVEKLLNQLEYCHVIRRYKGTALGNLFTTEIVEAPTEPDQTPLNVMESHLLSVLRHQMRSDRFVHTDEQELAVAAGVSHETVRATLLSLKRRGYISATIADYGRPCIVKVLHEEPVAVETAQEQNIVDRLLNGRVPVADDSGKDGMLIRFLQWQKDQRALEQEKIGEMLSQLTGN